jgi:hypothetical protein
MLFAPNDHEPNPYVALSSYTTRLTYAVNQLPAQDSKALGTVLAYLEESFQPPYLEDTLSDQDSHLENTPPLDSAVCAFCCVTMRSFPNDDI